MPYSFALPTTSAFSYSCFFSSDSHPSLPLAASKCRGVLRDTLKTHKRLPPAEQATHLPSVLRSLNNYLPFLIAIDQGLDSKISSDQSIDVVLKSTPTFEWRQTLSSNSIPGREKAKLKVNSLEYEIYFTLSSMAYSHTLLSRTSLYPLYNLTTALPNLEQRTLAITTATKHLLTAGSIHDFLAKCSENILEPPPCIDLSQSTFKALASLSLAEATLLAVLKDDPYPAVIAHGRNKCYNEWMIKSPDVRKVRVNLLARLCLAAAEHASNGLSLLNNVTPKAQGKINSELINYIEELRKCSRGKACRFFGIGAELDGQIGTAISWLKAGMRQVGLTSDDITKRGLKKLKKEWEEKREERRIQKESQWGNDAGRLEESRILEFLENKWSKINDLV